MRVPPLSSTAFCSPGTFPCQPIKLLDLDDAWWMFLADQHVVADFTTSTLF